MLLGSVTSCGSAHVLRTCTVVLSLLWFEPGAADDTVIPVAIYAPAWTKNQLTDDLTYGGFIYNDFDQRLYHDFASNVDDRRITLDPELGIALSYDPSHAFRFYTSLDATRFTVVDGPPGSGSSPFRLKLLTTYVLLRDVLDGWSVQVGRQRFVLPREWAYDETMDGARLHYRRQRFAAEASFSHERWLDENLLEGDAASHINNYALLARYLYASNSEASAYVLLREDVREGFEDLRYLGVQAIRQGSMRDYWFDAAGVTGEAGNATSPGGRILGWAVDVGGTYRSGHASGLALTASVAFGSGDADPTDRVDHAYRQSGVHDNNGKFSGVTTFRYYGELVRPQLSNLLVTTLGVGLRPVADTSVDLVYHYYRQHHAAAALRGGSLSAVPTGRSADLGHGLDLVIGVSTFANWDIELVLGAFAPGQAFTGNDNAYFTSFEFSYYF